MPFGILFPVITLVVVATTVTYLFMGDGGLTSLYLTLGWYALGMAIFLIRFYTNKKKGLVATEEVDKGE